MMLGSWQTLYPWASGEKAGAMSFNLEVHDGRRVTTGSVPDENPFAGQPAQIPEFLRGSIGPEESGDRHGIEPEGVFGGDEGRT